MCPSSKVELAQCSWCRATTTLRNVQPVAGWLPGRPRVACDRCGRIGMRCRTAAFSGHCNGLAREQGMFSSQLCAGCTKSVFDFGKTSAAWTLVGVVVGLLRPRR